MFWLLKAVWARNPVTSHVQGRTVRYGFFLTVPPLHGPRTPVMNLARSNWPRSSAYSLRADRNASLLESSTGDFMLALKWTISDNWGLEFLQMCNGIIAHRSTALGKNEFCHLHDEHQSHVFCLPCILSFLSLLASQLISEGAWVLHRLEIIRLVMSQGSHSFHWLPACHTSLKKAHLAMQQFMPWLSHLPRMDQAPEPWRSAQDLLVLHDREAEVLRKLFSFPSPLLWYRMVVTRPSFLFLYSACPPSTVQASLSPATFSHFHTDLPFHLLTPKSQDFFFEIAHCHTPISGTYRPPTTTCASCWSLSPSASKAELQPELHSSAQAEMRNPLGRWNDSLHLYCFHVTANIVPCPPVVRPSSAHGMTS